MLYAEEMKIRGKKREKQEKDEDRKKIKYRQIENRRTRQ